ncbi:hypothetical protein D9615_005624 [Tricholomella constricta]|uniref:F-box domain-containing protein n=1 Tax=Tricholomella constricta TaxID=117010 RepID=A0A8H5HDR2_9AGAR|nr:hypothetical protein D9615_005624 [Tricholomella constricta]
MTLTKFAQRFTCSPSPISPFHGMPPELIDLIIDHAHADRSLLAACSLVCKAWFPAARYHLFSNTKLNVQNALSFVHLIESTSSTVSPFVRHIDAKDNCEGGRWVDDLFLNLTSLPYITSISLTSSCDAPLSQITLFTLCSFDRLVELRLAECEFRDFTEVQQLICSFPMLEILYLEADWPEPRTIDLTDASPSPYLRELYLRCEMSHVLEWFLLQPSVAPVSKLTLHGLDSIDLPVVSRYLRRLGPALTHLIIPRIGSVVDSLSDHLDLSLNACLRYLKLGIDSDVAYLSMARTLLSQLDSPFFEEVELSLYSVRQSPKVARYWTDLDTLLTGPHFPSMKRATVSAMSAVSLAKEVLPLCHERGVLQVQHH